MKFVRFLWPPLLILGLFLISRLLAPLGWLIDLPLAAVVFLNLNRLPGRWSAFLSLGLLMDFSLGSPAVFLSAWLLLCLGLYLATAEFSLSNQLGRWLLAGGVITVYWLLALLLSRLAGWLTNNPWYDLLLKMSFWQIAVYLLLNTLIVGLAGQFFYRANKGKYVEIS